MIRGPRARTRRLSLLGLLLAGRAWADPAPLLGPGGPTWFGPLPPEPAERAVARFGTVSVDPASGALWVAFDDLTVAAEPDPLRLGRAWDGDGWRWRDLSTLAVDPAGITWSRPEAPARGFPPLWPDPTQRVCQAGAEVEDGAGAVVTCLSAGFALRLPDGTEETFDEAGRMVARRAPAHAVLTAGWGDDGLAWLERGALRVTLGAATVQAGRRVRLASGPAGEEVRYETDDRGYLAAVTAADGMRHRYHYDDGGRLRSVVWSDGSSLVIRRDGQARILGMDGPGLARWRFAWGDDGLARAWDGRGAPWQIRRSPREVTVVDPAGRSASALLADGRLAGWRDPGGMASALTRDEGGRPVQIQDGTGARWDLRWDEQGRIAEVADPSGGRWRLLREPGGRETRLVDPLGRTRRIVTDDLGRVLELADAGVLVRVTRDPAGLVRQITEGTGSSVRLTRDASGRLVGVEDATGAVTRLEQERAGHPTRVDDPAGGRWKFAFDTLGRVCGLDAPDGSHTDWTRAPGGRLAAVRRDRTEVRFDRRTDGAATRLRDPLGRFTGWALDATGHARAWLRGDGARLEVELDGWGLPRAVGDGVARVTLARDALGRPLELRLDGEEGGPLLTWRRDAAGRVVAIRWPGGDLDLERDPAGALRAVRLGGLAWSLERDLAGRLAAVEGGGRRWELRRDDAGRVTAVGMPSGSLSLALDPRGLPRDVEALGLSLHIRRDAAGRTAQLLGPEGVVLGVQRDGAGHPTLVRLPGGGSLRVARSGLAQTLTLEDPAGRILSQAGTARDALGRASASWDDAAERRFRWGPRDELLSVEASDVAWSVFPGRREGPQGAPLVSTDAAGRPTSVAVGAIAPLWGIATGELRYQRDEHGFLARVEGDRGVALLDHDPLGRLVRVRLLDPGGDTEVASFALRWDPFGRPELIEGSAGRTLLRFLGGRLFGLQEGERPALALHADPGVWILAGPGGHVVQWSPPGAGFDQAWSALDARALHRPGPGGLRPVDFPGALALQDRIQLFPGGPLVGPLDALDPVSGTPTAAPPGVLPWAPTGWPDPGAVVRWPDPDGAADVPWDPARWGAPDPWGDPLALLVRLGEIAPPFPGSWWSPEPAGAPLPWLPASLEGAPPAVLPAPGALPMGEEPVAALFLAAALRPLRAPSADDVVRTLLAADLADLPPAWPGLPVPEPIPSPVD